MGIIREHFIKNGRAICLAVLFIVGLPLAGHAQYGGYHPTPDQTIYAVKPSAADPQIRSFNNPSLVIFKKSAGASASAQLVVFMNALNSTPVIQGVSLSVINAGYRLINLEYNANPEITVACEQHRDPLCASDLRQDRIYGGNVSTLGQTPPHETVMNRLVTLLAYLDHQHPDEHWGDYLVAGQPKWDRIVVSGFALGAGMAAFIAKREQVARVVLFSGPWDVVAFRTGLMPAAWLNTHGVTRPNRWYASYHVRQKDVERVIPALTAMTIPIDHVRVLNLDLLPGDMSINDNPYPASTTTNPGYANDWAFLFGQSPG